jgi:serine/threonine protein kinase/tetratricopeptide (TPR) repeat protein
MRGFASSRRFEVVRALGQGGMGVVYEVFDREQVTTCALKLLPKVTPRALSSFKQEFRALQGLNHPNLITLGELLSENDDWFFTMELVAGVDFLTWVRDGAAPSAPPATAAVTLTLPELQDTAPPSARPATTARIMSKQFDELRLRTALAQLAEGLRFLHDAGKVHCDVKPSNVLVTDAGRVVLLDFGLVAERAAHASDAPESGILKGTPAYMAPEQVQGGRLGPAADQYAFGAMLFHALTGVLPFPDCSLAGLMRRRASPVPRPRELVLVPGALDDLCVALLDPNPAARPSAREVLARLGAAEVPELREPKSIFVGRRKELEQLAAAYQHSVDDRGPAPRPPPSEARLGSPVLVALQGPSGIGKSALVEQLLTELRAREVVPLVLTGRCYEHEGIPYKAIDGVMDALAEHLVNHPSELGGALPANAPLLGVLFPVLARVPGFASRSAAARNDDEPRDAHEMRRDAERAGRALLHELVARRPLVICIDDFQWADADSMAFLTALSRAPDAPSFMLLLSSRSEVTLPFEGDLRRIILEPLSPSDARALAASLLEHGEDGIGVSAEAIAKEAGGHPFFVHELVWRPIGVGDPRRDPAAHVRLEDVLWDRISKCVGAVRDVLELVAVAAAPIRQSVVAEAAKLDAASFARAAQELRAERLVRTTGIRPTDEVEAYHDRIRETVVGKLAGEPRAAGHLALAHALERQCPDDLDALVTHYEGGGDGTRAAEYAVRAGDVARSALAFERAAAFYRRAIERLAPEVIRRQRLHLHLAEALANAGMGAEAAVEFERAAEDHPDSALELRRRAAEHWLTSGRLDQGLTALRGVLSELRVRMPKAPATTFASLLYHRARVRLRGLSYRERSPSTVPAVDLLRVDALWAATASLGPIDTIRAADFQAQHLLLCLDLGEPFRVARALLGEVSFASMAGPRRWSRTEQLLAMARSIAARIDEPYATAMLHFAEGFAHYQAGRYRRAHAGLERGAELFRSTCNGASHYVAISKRFAIDCLFQLGELARMRREVPALLEDAERRGDLYLAAELRTGLPNIVWLCADQPDEARRATELGIARWPRHGFYLQHYYHALASGHIALYLGDGRGAHRTVEAAWPGLRKSLLLGVQAVRTEALYLRARAAIADGGARAADIARKMVRELEGDAVAAAAGFAAAARAGLASRARDRDATAAYLRTAERTFAAADVGLYAAACRFHIGRIGGGGLSAETSEAEAWMRAHGVVRPDRFAHLLVPGTSA